MTRIAPVLSALAMAWLVAACEVADAPPDEAVQADEPEPDGGEVPEQHVEPSPPAPPERELEVEPEPPAEAAPTRLVWVAVENDDRTVLIDLDAGEAVEDVATPGSPHNLTVAADGTAAVALYATTDLAVVSGGQVETATLGGRLHDVKATDEWFVVANEAGRRIEFVSLDAEPGSTVELSGEPHDLAIDPEGEQAWVTLNGRDDLAIIDLATTTVDRYVPTDHAPHDLLFAPDGRLWVTDWTGLLLVLDGDEVVHRRELGVEAHHLAFTPDGREVWITDHGTNELFVLDADTVEVLEVVDLPGAPHHVAITTGGDRAAVADHTNGQLLVFDVATREQIAAIDVGPGPHGVWAVPPDAPPGGEAGSRDPWPAQSRPAGHGPVGRLVGVVGREQRAHRITEATLPPIQLS